VPQLSSTPVCVDKLGFRPPNRGPLSLLPSSLFALAWAVLLAGCASTVQYQALVPKTDFKQTPELAPGDGNARIYVLRRSRFAGSGVSVAISDTGNRIGKIASGGILTWDRAPGLAILTVSTPVIGGEDIPSNLSLTVSAADVVLLEAIYPTGRIDSATASWRVLSGEEGKSLLQQLKRN
jgi:hypothetical protein